ncbi:Uncharacterised protein [uncultured archaeon]|nr:Uncharacterised protein [uncultured archaeon]
MEQTIWEQEISSRPYSLSKQLEELKERKEALVKEESYRYLESNYTDFEDCKKFA